MNIFLVLIVFIVCIRNTAMFKLIPPLSTHVYSHMFSIVHPLRFTSTNVQPPRGTIREPLFNCWSGNVRKEREEIGGAIKNKQLERRGGSNKRNNDENEEICGGGWRFGLRRRRNG